MKLQSNVYDGGQEPYGLERLEVLRGASSMLYGQLAPGGIINAISKRPTEQPLHEVNLEYGSYDRKQISADFGGPLTQDGTLLYRLTGLYRDAENWVDDTPDDKVYIAPAITWAPNDSTSLTVLASYQHVNTRFSTPLLYQDVASGTIPRNLFLGVPDFDRYESDMYTLGYLFEHEFDNGLKLRSKARYYAGRRAVGLHAGQFPARHRRACSIAGQACATRCPTASPPTTRSKRPSPSARWSTTVLAGSRLLPARL